MTHITYADGIAIGKLVFYTPCFFVAAYVSIRHGWGKNSGWIYLAIFGALRIINGASWLATINNSNPETAYTISLITGFLGLSPLLLASLGLLSRVFHEILKPPYQFPFTVIILKLIQTPAGVGLILCIVGATSADNIEDITEQATIKAGVVIFCVVFVAISILSIIATMLHKAKHRGEAVLVFAVLFSLPFLLVRSIAALLDVFSHIKELNPITGSQTVQLCMDVLMEAAVVLIYLIAGIKAPILSVGDRAQLDLAGRASKGIKGFGNRKGGFRGRRGGLIALGVSTIVGMVENARNGKDTEIGDDGFDERQENGREHRYGQGQRGERVMRQV